MHERVHEGEVAEERDEAVGQVKAGDLAGAGGSVAAVAPGVVEVPCEVVEEGEFQGEGGGEEDVVGEDVVEEGEGGELDGGAD